MSTEMGQRGKENETIKNLEIMAELCHLWKNYSHMVFKSKTCLIQQKLHTYYRSSPIVQNAYLQAMGK